MMKIFALTFVCLIFFSTTSISQIALEFEAGRNFANASPPSLAPTADWKTRSGYVGALLASFPLSTRLSVQTGLRFIQKGTKIDFVYDLTATHNYIEFPVYARFEAADFGSRLLVSGGPAFSFLANSYVQGSSPTYGTLSHNTNDQYKSYDVSLDGGFDLVNPIFDKLAFIISAKYSFGLIEIDKTGTNEESRDIRLTAGVAYCL